MSVYAVWPGDIEDCQELRKGSITLQQSITGYVCRNIRNVKLKVNNFVFQHAFYCHVCNCSLCAISH